MPDAAGAVHSSTQQSSPLTAAEQSDNRQPTAQRNDRRLLHVAFALALIPVAVSAVSLSIRYGNAYNPIGDMAAIELFTRDVGQRAVMIGPYSRDGWHHPGPAMFYLLAVPYRLLGSTSTAMTVGALTVNGASIVGMGLLARRRGGTPLTLIVLVGCALLMRSLGPDEIRLPWNPFITVLPFGVLVLLTWSLTCRDRWLLPLAVLITSYLAQTHIGYVALAVPLLVFGTVWLVASTIATTRRARDGDDRPRTSVSGLAAPALTGLVVGLVMWLPPCIEQLSNEPGNARRAFRWFRDGGSGGDAAQGLRAGWRIVSAQFGLPPEWLFGSRGIGPSGEPPYLDRPLVPVLLFVVAAGGVLLLRGPVRASGRLFAVWLFSSAVGVLATARTIGPIYTYRDGWAAVLAMIAVALVVWGAWVTLVRWRPDLERRVLVPGAVAGLALLAIVSSVAHARADMPQSEMSDRVSEVIPGILKSLPPVDGPVVIDGSRVAPGSTWSSSFWGLAHGPSIVLQLERHGIEAVLPQGHVGLGTHRMHDGGPRRAGLIVAVAESIPGFEKRPNLSMIAFGGELSLEELRSRVAEQTPVRAEAALAIFIEEDAGDVQRE